MCCPQHRVPSSLTRCYLRKGQGPEAGACPHMQHDPSTTDLQRRPGRTGRQQAAGLSGAYGGGIPDGKVELTQAMGVYQCGQLAYTGDCVLVVIVETFSETKTKTKGVEPREVLELREGHEAHIVDFPKENTVKDLEGATGIASRCQAQDRLGLGTRPSGQGLQAAPAHGGSQDGDGVIATDTEQGQFL